MNDLDKNFCVNSYHDNSFNVNILCVFEEKNISIFISGDRRVDNLVNSKSKKISLAKP